MLDKVEQYLLQQQQLYGSTLYFSKESGAVPQTAIEQDIITPPAQTIQETPSLSPVTSSTAQVQEQAKQQADVHTTMKNMQRLFNPPRLESKDMFSTLPAWTEAQNLPVLKEQICGCQNCSLGATRNQFVFGVGNPNADIVVIGEAPGADEDAQGEPFVGRAGQLLTKILEAINLRREDVYICNILKCRPPGNRRPLPTEVAECEPYLYKQLDIIQPKFILALGLTAVETLLKDKFKMADTRGRWLNYYGAPMIVTYHPAALLRNPEWKKYTWEDVKQLRAAYDTFLATGELPQTSSR